MPVYLEVAEVRLWQIVILQWHDVRHLRVQSETSVLVAFKEKCGDSEPLLASGCSHRSVPHNPHSAPEEFLCYLLTPCYTSIPYICLVFLFVYPVLGLLIPTQEAMPLSLLPS